MENNVPRLCGRCNRRLKTEKSRETGYGPVCHVKVLSEKTISEAQEKKNDPVQRVI